MGKIVLSMWMSLDGFIAGPDDGPDQGLGAGGERLHDFLELDGLDPARGRTDDEVAAAVMADAMELHVMPVLLGRGGGCSTTCRPSTSSSSSSGG